MKVSRRISAIKKPRNACAEINVAGVSTTNRPSRQIILPFFNKVKHRPVNKITKDYTIAFSSLRNSSMILTFFLFFCSYFLRNAFNFIFSYLFPFSPARTLLFSENSRRNTLAAVFDGRYEDRKDSCGSYSRHLKWFSILDYTGPMVLAPTSISLRSKITIPRSAYLDEDVRHFTSRLRVKGLFASAHTKTVEEFAPRARSINWRANTDCAIWTPFRRSNRKSVNRKRCSIRSRSYIIWTGIIFRRSILYLS